MRLWKQVRIGWVNRPTSGCWGREEIPIRMTCHRSPALTGKRRQTLPSTARRWSSWARLRWNHRGHGLPASKPFLFKFSTWPWFIKYSRTDRTMYSRCSAGNLTTEIENPKLELLTMSLHIAEPKNTVEEKKKLYKQVMTSSECFDYGIRRFHCCARCDNRRKCRTEIGNFPPRRCRNQRREGHQRRCRRRNEL